jgi:hypothetical protein
VFNQPVSDFRFEDVFSESPKVNNKEVRTRLEEIALTANDCLNTAVFAKYKDQFLKSQQLMVDAMIKYTSDYFQTPGADSTLYAMMMCRFVTRLQDLKMLLRQVEADASKINLVAKGK